MSATHAAPPREFRAGWATPTQRLAAIAVAAWDAHPASAPLRIAYVRRELAGECTFALCDHFASRHLDDAIRALLTETDGQSARETRLTPAYGRSDGATHYDAATGQNPRETHPKDAAAAGPAPVDPAAIAKARAQRVISALDYVRINNRPIGECTPREAMAWAASYKHKVRFVERLCAGIPEDDLIGRWVTPEYAEKLWHDDGAVS